jgi:transcriptional regulator with XRE-family HTH domain
MISSIRSRREDRAKDFGTTIDRWLRDRGVKANEFSALTGIEPSMISRYIKGERTPTYERACDIAVVMYPDDEFERERVMSTLGYTLYRDIMNDADVRSFAEMLTRGNVPDEYKQASRAMVRSLIRLTNGYK